jgi:3-methyladenine DNA glycosylase/8-oxoguanine DNA glycosylase
MQMSFERLQLEHAAKRRERARFVLDLAQAIVAGMSDKNAWCNKQKQLISEMNSGL